MSEAREAILAKLRGQYGRSEADTARAAERIEARLAEPVPNLVPARGQLPFEARVELFQQRARSVGAEIQRLDSREDVAGAVAAYLRFHNLPSRLVMAPDPWLDGCGFARQPLLSVHRGGAVEADSVSVTRGLAGIAETGTLLLASAPSMPTLLAFLPESSIVVLPSAAILGAYEQAWAELRAEPGWPPRSVNLITGPSRTGDIPPTIELGAHGPRRLLILLVDEVG